MTNTINVPRELLERTIDRLKYGHEHDKALRELRAILATAKSAAADDERMRFDLWAEQQGWPKDHTMLHELWLAWKAGALKYAPSPAGVEVLEVVGTLRYFMDYPDSPHSAPGYITHQFNPASWDHAGEAAGEHKLCRLSDAQAIIDGLRGENEALQAQVKVLQSDANSWQSGYDEGRRMGGKHCALTIDQQAQRIGELEGLLRDSAELIKHGVFEDGYCCCGSSVDSHGLSDGHSPVDALAYHAGQVCERIESALSAGKDSAP